MPTPVVGLIGASVASGVAQSRAASKSASAQAAANEASIAEQRRQFDLVRETLAPYVDAGNSAVSRMLDLLGLSGSDAQQSAISGIQQGSAYQTALKEGENAILQNASATGGLRGGNTQAALSEYAPSLLNHMVQQQYSNLGGLANIGQASAAGVGSAAMQTGQGVGATMQNTGQAYANSAIQRGNAWTNTLGNLSQIYGMSQGYGPGVAGVGIW